jgi:hypothetical protein
MAAPWWVISVSTLNGKPWQAVSYQGVKSAAQAASQGGILAGPFATDALAVKWGNAWSARTHHAFTDNPGVLPPVIPNPVKGIDAIGAFFTSLSDPALWARILKIGIGSVLLLVGLAKITGADKTIAVAGKAVAAAPLL